MKRILCSVFFAGILNSATNATSEKLEGILSTIEHEQIEYIRYQFVDLLGNAKSYTVTQDCAQNTLAHGVNVDGSSLIGFQTITQSDLLLKPDLNTFCCIPGEPSARVICDVCAADGSTLSQDPRSILKQARKKLAQFGYRFIASCELEFFLVQEKKFENIMHGLDNCGYCEHSDHYASYPIILEMLRAMRAMGLEPEKTHHEVAPGQHEITLKYCEALKAADNVVCAKNIIRYIAKQHGYRAVFMPKPFTHMNGSGLHTNFSMQSLESNQNAFFDASRPFNLSKLAEYSIAGVLKHIASITALLNPTVNSYKRLVVGYEAPVYIAWGYKNRSVLLRIPEVGTQAAQNTRAELRSPDPSCNPYLALAAIMYASIEGISVQLTLPPATDENLFEYSPKELMKKNIRTLPTTLSDAIVMFSESEFIKQCFGSLFQNTYRRLKENEATAFAQTITNWELETYKNL